MHKITNEYAGPKLIEIKSSIMQDRKRKVILSKDVPALCSTKWTVCGESLKSIVNNFIQ